MTAADVEIVRAALDAYLTGDTERVLEALAERAILKKRTLDIVGMVDPAREFLIPHRAQHDHRHRSEQQGETRSKPRDDEALKMSAGNRHYGRR